MKSKQISFCAIMAALSAVIMLVGWFPYFTYAVPCVASLTIMVVTIEYGKISAIFSYIASLLPIMLFSEIETKILYLCFVGFYPVLKAIFEKIPSRAIEYLLKLASINAGILLVYLVSSCIFGVTYDDLGNLGKYGAAVFIVLANVTFFAYDICLSKMAQFYIVRFHSRVQKMLRK